MMVVLASFWSEGAHAETFQVWPVDPLVKVFRDAAPAIKTVASADLARGETATFQLVVKSDQPLAPLQCVVGAFKKKGGAGRAISGAAVRFVGYVPVDIATPNPSSDQLRKPPADYPDPLLEDREISVKANDAQPIWITVKVPLDAPPGAYTAEAKVMARVGGRVQSVEMPLTLNVFNAKVDKPRLWVTNWFHMSGGTRPAPKADSPEYWARLRSYVRNMVAHNQNVARVAPLRTIGMTDAGGGKLRFDFRRFDQWLRIFSEEGVRLVEGQQFGWRKGAWEEPFVVSTYVMKNGKATEVRVEPNSAEAERFYSQFLPALQDHLAKRGLLDRYVQHVADEPLDANAESYAAISRLVRKYAPRLRILDAAFTTKLIGAIDIWVPHLDTLHHNYDFFKQRQVAGDEVWYYTCVAAQGEYANRFMEQPLIKTRLLHWINARYGVTGYLHWGYNAWTDDPFTDPVDVREGNFVLPAGESWIVYPGKNGVIDSIRFEAMRDGIADHELLAQLGERDPAAAMALAQRHVIDFDKYETDVAAFRATRREILESLSRPPARTHDNRSSESDRSITPAAR